MRPPVWNHEGAQVRWCLLQMPDSLCNSMLSCLNHAMTDDKQRMHKAEITAWYQVMTSEQAKHVRRGLGGLG